MFLLIHQNTQYVDIQNIVPRICCTSTAPSRIKLIVSKFLKPFEYFSSSAHFSTGLAAAAGQIVVLPLLAQQNSIYHSYASILTILTSALSVYLTSCCIFKYVLNKVQPTHEEYNNYLISVARNIIVKHPTKAVSLQLVQIKTESEKCKSLDTDASFNMFIKMLVSEYLNLDDPEMDILNSIVISLLKQLYLNEDNIIDIYNCIHQQWLKKLTAESTGPLFSIIYSHYLCEFSCPRKIRMDRGSFLFRILMENELSDLEKRYREIQEVLFKVGLGRQISHFIVNSYEDLDTVLKKFIEFARRVSDTESRCTFRKLVYFLLNSSYCQDFHKATKLVAGISDEQLRTKELAKIIRRHPSREEAILSYLAYLECVK